ncbi:MAG: sulfatase-like hydrolase/transferase [Victivallaceae bacterium]|nr:sulfatase-like hydrolase/transferase [Victivallaceae bacterium]
MANFLILMSDEHNPFYSVPYGHETVQTPNMQALAERGVVFENAYCPSPLCLPSRSAFISGQRVHKLQTYSNCNFLVDPTPRSFGAALAQQGVHSAYIGKTDVYAPGNQLGFTEMIRPGDRIPPGDRNHRRNPMTIRHGAAARADGYGARDGAAVGDVQCVDAAVKWLRETAPDLTSSWVLVVNVVNPHFPHIASPEFWELYSDANDLPQYDIECETAQHPYAEMIRKHFETEQFTPEQARGLRRGYLACISFVDQQLGRLVTSLNNTEASDKTNIVYTSDHGDMLGKFGMWWKCSLYDDAARIPMIAAGPDFASGERITTPVDLHDLQASLFTATNTTQPAGWLGKPLQNIPLNDATRVVFSEYHGHGAPGSSYMVRKGQWKYIWYTDAPPQLFNLQNDPDELINLSTAEPDMLAELDGELRNICSPEIEHERAEQFIETQLKM